MIKSLLKQKAQANQYKFIKDAVAGVVDKIKKEKG
jgi:hypothetical protein